MPSVPQITDELTLTIRELRRRLSEAEARANRVALGRIGTPFSTEDPSSAYTGSGVTDMVTVVDASATRDYRVNLKVTYGLSAAATFFIDLRVDGTAIDLFAVTDTTRDTIGPPILWQPSIDDTYTLAIGRTEIVPGGNLTLAAGAGQSRQLWVEDIGPRQM